MRTERLYLRKLTKENAESIKLRSIEDQLAFYGCDSLEALRSDMNRYERRFANVTTDFMMWHLIETDSEMVVGSCGFHNWDPQHERAELGYFLYERYRGKGMMTEALYSVVKYGFDKMGLNRVEALISPENHPSLNIIKRLKFTQEGVLREHYKRDLDISDSIVFSLLKKEYK